MPQFLFRTLTQFFRTLLFPIPQSIEFPNKVLQMLTGILVSLQGLKIENMYG